MNKSYLVTGGTGFIGAALVRRLVQDGGRVRVLDNQSRGALARLADMAGSFEMVAADIRDQDAVARAVKGVDCVCHLAFINGTEFFYSKPELVLEVGVKGMVNVLDACLQHDVGEIILASSSEVYQQPPSVPTDESVPLVIPDPLNPRYSYAAGKMISEVMAINYGRKYFRRTLIFRPHNVYGPNMGWEHVIPQFAVRLSRLSQTAEQVVRFPIQGSGRETRAFVYIDDFVDGLALVMDRGENLGIYHIGTTEEVAIGELARLVGRCFGKEVELAPGEAPAGATSRRCPDIGKIAALGYRPRYALAEGLPLAVKWYAEHSAEAPGTEK